LARALREGRLRAAVPDVRLRIRLFRADPVVDLLGAHVEPADVDLRMQLLEALLHQAQEVAAMRRIEDERRLAAARAGRNEEKRDERESAIQKEVPRGGEAPPKRGESTRFPDGGSA